MSNNLWIGHIDENFEQQPKQSLAEKLDESYPSSTLLVFAENQPIIFHKKKILNALEGVRYELCVIDKILDNFKCQLKTIESAQNRRQTETVGLAKLIYLKIVVKVVITVELDIQNRLMNSQVGETAECSMIQK